MQFPGVFRTADVLAVRLQCARKALLSLLASEPDATAFILLMLYGGSERHRLSANRGGFVYDNQFPLHPLRSTSSLLCPD